MPNLTFQYIKNKQENYCKASLRLKTVFLCWSTSAFHLRAIESIREIMFSTGPLCRPSGNSGLVTEKFIFKMRSYFLQGNFFNTSRVQHPGCCIPLETDVSIVKPGKSKTMPVPIKQFKYLQPKTVHSAKNLKDA